MGRRANPDVARAVAMAMAEPPHNLAPPEAAAACNVGYHALYAALRRAGHAFDRSAASKRALADPAVRRFKPQPQE